MTAAQPTDPPDAPARHRHTSLALQLVLLAVLPALLASAVLIVLTTRHYLRSVEEHTRGQANAVALQMAASAQDALAREDRRALLRLARSGMSQPHVQQVQIWSGDGELLANVDTDDIQRLPGLQISAPVIDLAGRGHGQVMLDMSLAPLRAAEQRAWLNVLAIVLACLVGVLLAAVWAARRIGAPVRELARAVDRLGRGELARLQVHGAPELMHLQQGFNAAAQALHDHRQLLEQRIEEATAQLALKNRQIEYASQAKTRLLAAASHDLRQPLYALTLSCESLANGETDPARLERIRHLRESVTALDHLFTELLNISQIDAGVLQPRWSDFALDRVFDDLSRTFRPVAEAQHLRLVVRPTDAWVHSDYFMLSRIVGNLVANALRYTEHGGVLLAARQRGDQVRIDVVDTGVGIAPEHQQRIFEEFYQVDSRTPDAGAPAGRGMGLGLATVQRLAALLGARVMLTSRPGRGTWFRVEVPLVQATADATPLPPTEPVATAAASVDGLRVLVIEDDMAALEGLRLLLTGWGAEVSCARDTAQALRQAEHWRVAPDVVLADQWLGGDETGLDALQALGTHSLGGQLRRVLVTGQTGAELQAAAAAMGAQVLHKPVAPAALLDAILGAGPQAQPAGQRQDGHPPGAACVARVAPLEA